MVLDTYGRSSGFCIDPIEKKPLFHFHPGSRVLSFGTAGCNLGCRFCQNWEISKARYDGSLHTRASPEDIAASASSRQCRSVAFTYNDPVIFAEYAIDTARACREVGIDTIAVTAGYIAPEAREDFFAVMSATNIDLKAFNDEFYRKWCLARLAPVLETLEFVARETDAWLEVTTLLIPGVNDSDREIAEQSAWMVEHLGEQTPLHLTAFHPDYKMREASPTPASVLHRAREVAISSGLRNVYTGNIRDPRGSSTYCSHCDALLIERRGYSVTASGVSKWRCVDCGAKVPGVFA